MPNAEQLRWLESLVPAAQETQKFYGVPASVTLAQCILESGWGHTQLSKECNNYFGIKAEHLDQPNTYKEFLTAEYEDGKRVIIHADFEKYPDVGSSFRDHARLIAMAPRYSAAMVWKNNPLQFCHKLQVCGYSTSPTYGQTLANLIVDLKLTQYDKETQ